LAQRLASEGINTPQDMAAFLDDVAPGRLHQYAQSLWDIMGAVGAVERGTHDWGTMFPDLEIRVTDDISPGGELDAGTEQEQSIQDAPDSDANLESDRPGTGTQDAGSQADVPNE